MEDQKGLKNGTCLELGMAVRDIFKSRQFSSQFFPQKSCQGNCQINCVKKKNLQGNYQVNFFSPKTLTRQLSSQCYQKNSSRQLSSQLFGKKLSIFYVNYCDF